VTEPLLQPIRRLLPRSGGIDFSPIVLWLIVYFMQAYLIGQCGFGIIMRQLC
jgi:YggT family protein